jgi:hypothetical protein
MPLKMKTQTGGVDIQDGTYKLTVLRIEETEFEDTKFGKGKQAGVKFTFAVDEVLDEENQPIELTANATAERLTPKTKLWGWVEALRGQPWEQDQDVDLEELIACEAMGKIVNEPDADGIKWARVKELMALPTTQTASTPAKTAGASEGFLKTDGSTNWQAFMTYADKAGVSVTLLAETIGAEKVSQKGIMDWLQAEPGRSLTGLVEAAKAKLEPDDDLPFE